MLNLGEPPKAQPYVCRHVQLKFEKKNPCLATRPSHLRLLSGIPSEKVPVQYFPLLCRTHILRLGYIGRRSDSEIRWRNETFRDCRDLGESQISSLFSHRGREPNDAAIHRQTDHPDLIPSGFWPPTFRAACGAHRLQA